MDSVKNKMESLVKEKDHNLDTALTLEQQCTDYKNRVTEVKTLIGKTERNISKAEDQLDSALTNTKKSLEELEIQSKIASDSEQEVAGLVRKIALLDDESKRVNERLAETLDKLTSVEREFEECERQRKSLDARSLSNEEKIEIQEAQLQEAKFLAEEADRKFDEIDRKLRIVETEYERVIDKAEQFEQKCAGFEEEIKGSNERVRELEDLSVKNGEKEDDFEKTVYTLTHSFSAAEDRAEFGERTVDKLEKTIDGLDDQLYQEKKRFQEVSLKIDAMLADMRDLHNLECDS